MTFQAYLDAVKAKTGKTSDDFRVLAEQKGLVKSGEIVAWLKSEFGLGHGHASAIAHLLVNADAPKLSQKEQIATHFTGGKAVWRKAYDALFAQISTFGADIETAPTKSYISLLRHRKKFAIVAPTSERLDIGIKLKGVASSGRLEAAGTWNSMVTHRVRISDPTQIDAEVLAWLKQAFDEA